jgi:hypothetical protein
VQGGELTENSVADPNLVVGTGSIAYFEAWDWKVLPPVTGRRSDTAWEQVGQEVGNSGGVAQYEVLLLWCGSCWSSAARGLMDAK